MQDNLTSREGREDARGGADHWADATALRIVKEKGDLELYTVASGITPSGTVHIGNFREIITVDLVARALRSLGKNVRFIYSWDDYDVFRKVPANMPDPDTLKQYLRFPITETPDTTGRDSSYARHNEVDIERELPRVGIHPEFLYQSERYRAHLYADAMRRALQMRGVIKECLNEYRDEAHKMRDTDEYWPVSVFCAKCGRDTTRITSYDGEWAITYECDCGHKETVDLREFLGAKLGWRVDWPMRWKYEKVVFEPGGKDHISPGGSYDTAKLISRRVYDWDAPVTMKYDFVKLKGVPGKMSSSAGKVISLPDALEVYQPEVLRYIFAQNRPDHEFSISFDLDVVTMYEAYDKTERIAWGVEKAKTEELARHEKRLYELSQIDGMPDAMPYQMPFRQLTVLLQTYSGDIEKALASLKDLEEEQRETFRRRALCAWYWITECAPTCAPDFCFSLREGGERAEGIEGALLDAVRRVRDEVVPRVDTFPTDRDTQQAMYNIAKECGVEPKALFTALYRALVAKDQGPRLAGFFRIIGREKLSRILEAY